MAGAVIDRGGPSPNLAAEAKKLLRRHGKDWLRELQRLADMGDGQAIAAIAAIARQEPPRRGGQGITKNGQAKHPPTKTPCAAPG